MRQWTGSRWFAWLLRGVLLAATAAAYLPSFHGAFVFDDLAWIVGNGSLQRATPGSLADLAWSVRPVVVVSLWANYQLGGLDVFGYHVVNFAVHVLAGWTLFGLVRRTLRLPASAPRWGQSADGLAFVVALLWLVHPLQTQAVTYVIQRCESMMGLCYLVVLYCVLRAAQSSRAWPWCTAAIAAGWVGMGCKEIMATAVVVVPLFDRIFLATSWSEIVRRRWAVYLALALGAGWLSYSVFYGNRLGEMAAVVDSDPGQARWRYLGTQPSVLLNYLRLAALPDKLCFDYQRFAVSGWGEVLWPGLAVAGLAVASLLALAYWPRVGFLGCAWFLVLAPTSSVFPIADVSVEHRMYLPLAVLMVLAVLAGVAAGPWLVRRVRQREVLYGMAVVVLVAAWGTRTYVRNGLYIRPSALWANVLAQVPDNARARNNYGCYLLDAGKLDEAEVQFQRAAELSPDAPLAHCNLARIAAARGDLDLAISRLRHALSLCGPAAWLHVELAGILERQGRTEETLAEYQTALECDATCGLAHFRLGRLLLKKNRFAEAIPHFLAALEEKPRDALCHRSLATAYQRTGEEAAAAEHFRRAAVGAPQRAAAGCIPLSTAEGIRP